MNAYHAAHHGVIVVDLNTKGRLQLIDQDRLDLINRMSTNNLTELSAGQAMETVLTSPVGRIIDVLTMLNMGEQALAITGEGRRNKIFNYLKRNIFFRDKVKVVDLTESTHLIGVYGAKATEYLTERIPVVGDLAEFRFVEHDGLTILRVHPLVSGGYWVLGDPQKVMSLQQHLLEKGAVEADAETYELLCIEAGLPISSHELTEDYIPLEAGLWHAVSFSKGCYTGQEIIARMESRGKLAKMLVRISADTAVPVGTELMDDGAKVGVLTSMALQPEGHYLGLGFVKPAIVGENTSLWTAEGIELKILGIAGTQR